MIAGARVKRSAGLLGLLGAASIAACFDAGATRGQPCSEDASCGGLACDYGVCGGPQRCERGAGVGDYCFVIDAASLELDAPIDSLAIGDVDLDAWPDLVVGSGEAQLVALLRNDGAGTLQPPIVSGPLGIAVSEVSIGDVDRVGWRDVAVLGDDRVLVVPVGGAGTFDAAIPVAQGLASPRRVQVGEFVDDVGRLADVAVLVDDGVMVLPQIGAASFGDGVRTAVARPTDVRILGLDMERMYVASRMGDSVISHTRTIGGAFTPTTTIVTGAEPVLFALADVDADGDADLVTAGADGAIWLTTRKSALDDDWSSNPVQVYTLGWAPTALAAVNLDDDAAPEFVVAGEAPSGTLDVLLFDNDGDGRFVYGGSLEAGGAVAAVVDLELDGVSEIVVASPTGEVRVARRTVAPPPVGTESSGGETTAATDDSTDPIDSSWTTDPTLDPSTTGDDTDGSCPMGVTFGPWCYGFFETVAVAGEVAAMAAGDVDGDAWTDLAFALDTGAVQLERLPLGAVDPSASTIFSGDFAPPLSLAVTSLTDGNGSVVPTLSVASQGRFTLVASTGGVADVGPIYDVTADSPSMPVGLAIVDATGVFFEPTTGYLTATGIAVLTPPIVADAQPPTVYGLPYTPTATSASRWDPSIMMVTGSGDGPELYDVSSGTPTWFATLPGVSGTTHAAVLDRYEGTSYVSLGTDRIVAVADDGFGGLSQIEHPTFGAVIDTAIADVDGDGRDDLLVLFSDGTPSRLLAMYPGGIRSPLEPPQLLLAGAVTHFTVDLAAYPPDLYLAIEGSPADQTPPAIVRFGASFF